LRLGAVVAFGLVALVAAGSTSAAGGTALYCGTKHVGTLSTSLKVRTLDGEAVGQVRRQGALVLAGNDPRLFENGYARIRIGGLWNVSRFFQGSTSITTTIGTVRRRSAGRWDAYLGFGGRARRVGYAVGPSPAFGAVGLLLVDGLSCG